MDTHLVGQLQILKLDPKASPSSRVLGRWVHSVSGRKRAATPPRQEKLPMMMRGRTWLITPLIS